MVFHHQEDDVPLPVNADRHLVVGDRVYVQGNKKRGPIPIKGKQAVVVRVLGKGTVMLQAPGSEDPPTRLQQKFTTLLGPTAEAAPSEAPPVSALVPSAKQQEPRSPTGQAAQVNGAGTPAAGQPHAARDVLLLVRSQMMEDEAEVPWNAVHAFWRNRRTKWRQATNKAERVSEMAQRVLDYRNALLLDSALGRCGLVWRQAVDACIAGQGSAAELLRVWQELRTSVEAWLENRDKPSNASALHAKASAARAVQALQQAAQHGSDAVVQVPFEAILNHDSESLQAVRMAIERERTAVAARLAQQESALNSTPAGSPHSAQQASNGVMAVTAIKTGTNLPPVEHVQRSDINAAASNHALQDDFDSGAETEVEEGSQVTVMSDDD